ncbi:MAG: hypothetical protein JO130_05430 [Solirubrobacterales bacterium]|nr:hypothetical protein [Solirubrobacterales bacterium]
MSALGVPPRVVAGIAVVLILAGIALAAMGTISIARAVISSVALTVIAALNWRRARRQ